MSPLRVNRPSLKKIAVERERRVSGQLALSRRFQAGQQRLAGQRGHRQIE